MIRVRLILVSLFFISSLVSLPPQARAAEKRNQLEELLIWKMSDELKLNTGEEKKFTETIRSLNARKAELNLALQVSIEKMGKADTKAKEAELLHYRKTLVGYNRLSEEEFDRLKPLLGADRFVQYLLIKQDLTNRIKSMLANPEAAKPKSSLPQPKVIEEK